MLEILDFLIGTGRPGGLFCEAERLRWNMTFFFFFPEKMLPASLLKMDGNRFLPINHGFDLTSFNSKSSNSFPFLLIPVYPIPFHYIFLTLFYKFHRIYVDMKFYSAY